MGTFDLIAAYQRLDAKIAAKVALGLQVKRGRSLRMMERTITSGDPCVHWINKESPVQASMGVSTKLAWLPKQFTSVGLRLLGNCVPEGNDRRHGGYFTDDETGWYTNDEGHSWKGGDGLCWGVVLILPGRGGKTRLVAGFKYGGSDDGPCMDMSRIFEGVVNGQDEYLKDTDFAKDAARHADSMAKDAAEEEREYDRQQREYDKQLENEDDAA